MVTKKKFCLSLNYNGEDSYLFVNGKEIVKFKAKDSAIVAAPLCLGNISKDWPVNNMKKTGLNEYIYEFSVDYEIFNPPDATKTVPFLHNYFIAKCKIKLKKNKMFQFIKKWVFFVSTFLTSVNSLSSVSMAKTNETRHIKWHETCNCKCRLDATVCNNKQRWNDDKCRCECKELIDKGVCDKGYA